MTSTSRINLSVMLTAALAALMFATALTTASPPVDTRADSAYQSQFTALRQSADRNAFESGLQALKDQAQSDTPRFITQLLIFSATSQNDPAAKKVVGQILRHIDMPKESIIRVLVPHLDNTDPAIVNNTRELLTGYEDRSVTRGPDFSTYRSIIESDVLASREPQFSLIRFMFETDPGAALRTMVRAMQLRRPDEIKPLLWAEHVVADLVWKRQYGFAKPTDIDAAAVEQLEKLSHHPLWWARLYVASMVKVHPELGTVDLLNRLRADPIPMVRDTMPRK